ncbi:MAG: hypothetical protein ABI980_16300 [Nitrospirota bacterium]
MKTLLFTGVGLSIVALISMAGCIKRPTTLGPDRGLAYNMALEHQIFNPDAGKNLDPVQGLEDPTAAQNTMERYRSSFEKPESYRTTITAPSVVNQGIQTR